MKEINSKIFLNILWLVAVAECHDFRSDYTYYEEAEGFFKFHDVATDWHAARVQCYNEGAILAAPTSPGIRNAMKGIMKERFPAKLMPGSEGIHVGIHATFAEGYFATIDGVPLSKMNLTWSTEVLESVHKSKACVAHFLNVEGDIYGIDCSSVLPYMCFKKEDDRTVNVNKCNTTENDYTFDNRTGSCYKFHRVGLPWPQAYLTCEAEGGYLAIINSEAEAEVLKDIFEKHPGHTLDVMDFLRHRAIIGFKSWEENGVFFTIHGQSLKDAGYDKFGPGEPNNYEGYEYCGNMYRSGLLNDDGCNFAMAFICEK